MAFQSMTGFGKAEKSDTHYQVQAEVKSVNGRYLDIQFRTNYNIKALENSLRKILEKHISRGNVICFIQINTIATTESAATFNQDLLQNYLAIIKEIQKKAGSNQVIDISSLWKLPDLIQQKQPEVDEKSLYTLITKAVEGACQDLAKMRTIEGKKLKQDITTRIRNFKPYLAAIKKELPARQKDYTDKMKQKFIEITSGDIMPDENRLMTELSILADKLDITEEIVRFNSHLGILLNTLNSHPTPGKKIGFILQEMLREVNTISSKCQYAPIQHPSVAMKEEIEIIREQALNLE